MVHKAKLKNLGFPAKPNFVGVGSHPVSTIQFKVPIFVGPSRAHNNDQNCSLLELVEKNDHAKNHVDRIPVISF